MTDVVQLRRRSRRWLRWVLVVGAIAAVGVGVWLFWFSSTFAVEKVTVVGAEGEAAAAVQRAANVPLGTPMALVDSDAIRDRIRQITWVDEIEVRRGWPTTVVLAVSERSGIARRDAQLVDATGVAFTPIGVIPSGLPAVRATGPALESAMSVYTALPEDVAQRVIRITAKSRDDVALTLKSGAVVRWGNADQTPLKAEVFRTLFKRKAAVYDVSAPELPTTYGEKR
jgi:cell division protein FtsQ